MSTKDYYKGLEANEDYFVTHETTLSEYLRDWNFHAILKDKLSSFDFSKTLEVGGGVGTFSKFFSDSFFVSLDLSVSLLKFQSRNCVVGDASSLPFKTGSFTSVIINVVLADMPVSDGLNTGALQVLKEVSRVLEKGGKCYVMEFGSSPIREVKLTGHSEFSIDFDWLKGECEKIGFGAELFSAVKFFGLNPDELVVKPVGSSGVNFLIKKGFSVKRGKLYNKELLGEKLWNFLEKDSFGFVNGELVREDDKHFFRLGKLAGQFKVLILEKN